MKLYRRWLYRILFVAYSLKQALSHEAVSIREMPSGITFLPFVIRIETDFPPCNHRQRMVWSFRKIDKETLGIISHD
jgi:hypothetical protein